MCIKNKKTCARTSITAVGVNYNRAFLWLALVHGGYVSVNAREVIQVDGAYRRGNREAHE